MEKIDPAYFVPISKDGNETGPRVPVHFNPASLQYQISNTLQRQGQGTDAAQYVSQSSGKLTMDLVFDTTHNGEDVRTYTGKLAALMEPLPGGTRRSPRRVQFAWGKYHFNGLIESCKETFDFFASSGIPLRAGVNLTLSSMKGTKIFEESTGVGVGAGADAALEPDKVVPTGSPSPGGGPNSPPSSAASPAQVASDAGNPRAARGLAAANGQESLRFSTSPTLTVSGSVNLRAAAAFAVDPASANPSAEANAFGFGASASAGVSASAGAFAGLRAAAQGTATLDTSRLLQGGAALSVGAGGGAAFAPGGRAQLSGEASLRADVGADASLSTRLRFEG